MFGWIKDKPKTAAAAGGSIITVVAAAGSLILADIKGYEGRELKPYRDIAGNWTACDGQRIYDKNLIKKIFTNEECDAITLARSIKIANDVCDSVTRPIEPNQLRAFATFSDNAGEGAWRNSTARREFNRGNDEAACKSLMKFVCFTVGKGQGEANPKKPCYSSDAHLAFSKGLENRRKSERDKCLKPWDGNPLPEGIKCR